MQHLRTLRREFLMLNYRLILGPDVGRPGASSTLSHIPYRCPVKRNSQLPADERESIGTA